MFYQRKQIDKKLNCPNCTIRFDIPKLLPCGKIICESCLISLRNKNEITRLNCPLCSELHEIPKNDFPICELIMELLEENPCNVYRGKAAETLKTELNQIQKNINDLDSDLTNGVDNIKEYCINLRTEVALATEKTIENINNLNDLLISEINTYEKTCIEMFESKADAKETFKKAIKDNDEFLKEWEGYLTNVKITDEVILKAVSLAKKNCHNLEEYKLNLKGLTFNEQLLTLKQNSTKEFDEGILGKLTFERINLVVANLEKVNITNLIPDLNKQNKLFQVECIDIGVYFVAYQNTNKSLIIFKVNTLNKRIARLDEKSISEHKSFKSLKIKRHKRFMILIAADVNKSIGYQISLDENLSLVRQADLSSNIIAVTMNDSLIYCLTSRSNSPLDLYNLQFQYLKSIGNSASSILFPSNIKYIDNRNGRFFTLSNTGFFNIIDEQKGSILATVKVNADKFMFDSNQNVLIVDETNRKIKYFDLSGNLINSVDLLGAVNDFTYFIGPDDSLAIFDESQFCFLINK